jgi:hydroxyacylglutathione hydrolase
VQDGDDKAVFTGDTLFHGGKLTSEFTVFGNDEDNNPPCPGCGKFFEGSAAEMHKALNKTLASLPDDTKVYVSSQQQLGIKYLSMAVLTHFQPGHEYTKSNVKFGISVLQNDAIKNLESFAENNKETQGKFTIADEKVSMWATEIFQSWH